MYLTVVGIVLYRIKCFFSNILLVESRKSKLTLVPRNTGNSSPSVVGTTASAATGTSQSSTNSEDYCNPSFSSPVTNHGNDGSSDEDEDDIYKRSLSVRKGNNVFQVSVIMFGNNDK